MEFEFPALMLCTWALSTSKPHNRTQLYMKYKNTSFSLESNRTLGKVWVGLWGVSRPEHIVADNALGNAREVFGLQRDYT